MDETDVPAGYTKNVTSDFTNLLGLGTMAAVGVVGFGVTALSLIAPRKKEEDEQ